MKKILVTGAGGFIGSHLVEALVKKGEKVRAFVHYNSFNQWGWLDTLPPEILKDIEVFAGDIRDPHGIRGEMYYIPQPAQMPAELHPTQWQFATQAPTIPDEHLGHFRCTPQNPGTE